FRVENANAGSTTVTVTYAGGQFPDTAWIAEEWAGIATSSALDVTANASADSTTSHSTGTTATTSQANELVWTAMGNEEGADAGWSADTGYSNATSQKGFDSFTRAFVASKVVSSIGTQTATHTTSSFVNGQGAIV